MNDIYQSKVKNQQQILNVQSGMKQNYKNKLLNCPFYWSFELIEGKVLEKFPK